MRRLALLALIPSLASAQWAQGVLVQDEGVSKGYAKSVNCKGAGIVCASDGYVWTITVAGGGGGGGSGLPADPDPCPAGQFATDQDASGTLTCSAVGWGVLTGKPGTFTPSAHTHAGTDVTSAVANATAATTATSASTAAGLSGTTGVASSSTYLRGDWAWTAVPGGGALPAGSGSEIQIRASASTFGVYAGSGTCAASNWMTALDGSGAKTCARPAYADLTGTPSIPADLSALGFVTYQAEAGLSAERVLTSGTNTTVDLGTAGQAKVNLSGTIPQSLGGTGAGALTCAGGTHLTSNGTAYSCSADTTYTLPAATGAALGGVIAPTCGAGNHYASVSAGTLQCTADAGGGGAIGTDKQIAFNNAGTESGDANLRWDASNVSLLLGPAPTVLPHSPITAQGNGNFWYQFNIQNTSSSGSASADYVATADTGNDTTNYFDCGINSSGYNDAAYTIGGALASYCYSNGGDFTIGTQTAAKVLKFHTGGTLAANLRLTLADTTLTLGSGVSLVRNGALATGLLKHTTATGVESIATSGTDYAPPTSGSGTGVVLSTTGTGALSTIPGTATTVLHGNAAGLPSYSGIALADHVSSLGTVNQVLHGNAAGQPSYGAVATADLTGAVAINKGGTNNTTLGVSAGGAIYADGSKLMETGVGLSGQALFSAGASAPAFGDSDRLVRLSSDYTNATTSMTNSALTWSSPAQVSRSVFDCLLLVKASVNTIGAQIDVNSSVAPTTIVYTLDWVTGYGTAPSTGGTRAFVQASAAATALGPATMVDTAYSLWRLTGIIVHTSSASTVTVRAKATNTGTVTISSGSACQYAIL